MEFFTFPGTLQLIESFVIVLIISRVRSYNGREVEPGAAAVHLGQEMQTKSFTVSNMMIFERIFRFWIYIVP